MEVVAQPAVAISQRVALLGIADDIPGQRMAREVSRIARTESLMPVVTTRDLTQLRELSARFEPAAILLDDNLTSGEPLAELLESLAALVPVVLIAPASRQAEIARIVATSEVDFVVRTGDFVPLAISLMERRMRHSQSASSLLPAWSGFSGNLGEIFRHEINNPLTGILGNAELLLSHRERMAPADTLRIQTVVDLAVRLRETIRRLSNAWDSQRRSLKSA